MGPVCSAATKWVAKLASLTAGEVASGSELRLLADRRKLLRLHCMAGSL